MNLLALPIGSDAPAVVNAVIEVPGGQSNKYEYDKKLLLFRLDRPLYSSVHYPGDYGFIPSTVAADGDALDILVLILEPTFPGCLVEARVIAVLDMLDQQVPDEKILAVAVSSPAHMSVRSHLDLAPHVLREIEHFFAIYKELEGKRTQVRGWRDVKHATDLIRECHDNFRATSKERGARLAA